jgi:hypothetical protein
MKGQAVPVAAIKPYGGDGIVAPLVVQKRCAYEHRFTSEENEHVALKTRDFTYPCRKPIICRKVNLYVLSIFRPLSS